MPGDVVSVDMSRRSWRNVLVGIDKAIAGLKAREKKRKVTALGCLKKARAAIVGEIGETGVENEKLDDVVSVDMSISELNVVATISDALSAFITSRKGD